MTATDELRDRMRLRLAMNAHRVHAHAGATVASGVVAGSVEPAAAGSQVGDVNHLVWNSVLESLTTSGQSPEPVVDPTPWPPLVQTPPPTYEPQPLYSLPSISLETGQRSLAELLAAAAASSVAVEVPQIAPPIAVEVPQIVAATPIAAVAIEPVAALPVTALPVTAGPVAVEPVAAVPSMIVPSMPVLGQPSRAAAPVRPGVPLEQPSAVENNPATKGKNKSKQYSNAASTRAKRNKRRPFRAFFLFILVAGILGGAAYAGWYQFLRNKVSWAADVAPIATDVEAALHQEFTATVPVETLSVPEYEVKLGVSVLADSYNTATSDVIGGLTALRAVGVLGPNTDAASIGHVVAAVRPSFYDRSSTTVYRIEGTTAFFQRSLANSLANALIDQRAEWSTGFGALTDAQRVAVLANVDELAALAVDTIAMTSPADTTAAASERAGRAAAVGLTGDQVPIVAALAIASGDNGGVVRPAPSAADPLATFVVPANDAAVLDPARDLTAAAVTLPAIASTDGLPARTLGMRFWYAAMVPALGVDAARGAALAWAGDSVTVSMVNGNFACISANIATFDEAGQAALASALTQWAQSRPASSTATVSTQPANVIAVTACEPAEGGSTAVATMDVGAIYSRAHAEADVATALSASGLAATPKAWGCAVLAKRGGSLSGYAVGTTDPAVIDEMTAITQFCSVP
ncbi:MAG: hypothetical protein ABIR32_12705 [Ilumatobacteraceae bacterium]